MRTRSILALVALPTGLAGMLMLGACAGLPVPTTAQAGSTVAIALGPRGTKNRLDVGYGGSDYTDRQRGSLVYDLEIPTGGTYQLETLLSTVVSEFPTASISRGNDSGGQIVSLVNIPAGAPTGKFTLMVYHVYYDSQGQLQTHPVSYGGSITILPNQIDNVPFPDGSTQTVTGTPTPLAALICNLSPPNPCIEPKDTTQQDVSSYIQNVAPDPEAEIDLTSGVSGTKVWAADLVITYPDSDITIVDAVEISSGQATLNHAHPATVWTTSPSAGQLTLDAAGTDHALQPLGVAFKLKSGVTTPIDPSQITVTVTKAWDQNGAEIPGTTAAVAGIY